MNNIRFLLIFLYTVVLSTAVSAQSSVGNATATYLAADACGNDSLNQFFILVVGGPTKYGFSDAPPQVKSYCPASSTVKNITSYSSNPALVAALNARLGGCQPVFFDILAAPFNGQAIPGTRLMLFTSPNPDISSWPANAFADLCGQAPVMVACGNYQGAPFFYNNNPYNNSCGAYSLVDVVIAGNKQTIQYKPDHLSPQDGAFVGVNQGNIRYGNASNCSCPGLLCPAAPAISFMGDLSICGGEQTTITALAGAGYTYLWSNGMTGASITVGPEMSTSYGVTVTHPAAPQCSWAGQVRVSVFKKPRIGLSTMGESGGPACYGTKMYLRTTGGQPIQTPFTYTWTPPNPSIIIAPDESITINEQTAGIYTITYNFSNGCVFQDQLEATYPAQVAVKTCNNSPVCTGEQVTLQVSNPPAGAIFSWKGPDGSTANTANVTLTDPAPGQYQIEVTDANGCKLSGASNVIVYNCIPANLTAKINITNTTCGLANATATAIAFSGTPPYVFDWAHTPGTNEPSFLQGLAAGFYTVTVTDADGTAVTATATIAGSSAPDPVVAVTHTACGNFNGAINLSVQYGTAPYSFDWADLAGPNEPQQRSGLQSGVYTVTVTDALGCTNSAQAVIDSSAGANITAVVTQIGCGGANNGAIDITVGGGSAPYTFNWADISSGTEPEDRTNLAPGTYSLTVTAQNGCTATFLATIQQPVPLILSATAVNATCNIHNGSIMLTVSGGTGAYNFDWSDLPGVNNPQHRTNLAAGTYSVTVSDANGCTLTATQAILQTGAPTATAVLSNIACFGNNNGAIQITTTGGSVPYSYNWADISTGTEPEDRTNLSAGNYNLTITDQNGCTFTGTYTIIQPASALTATASATNAACGVANGSITLNVTGGTPSYTFNWADLNNMPEPQNRQNLAAGTYTVTVTDSLGCSVVTSATITQPTGGTLSAVVTNLTCMGNFSGQINVTVSGSTGPFTYNWQDITTGNEPEDRTGLGAGTYTVTVTSASGCTTAQSWVVTQPAILSAMASTSTPTTCGLVNGTLTAVGAGGILPYIYDWSIIPGTNDPANLTNMLSGTYTIKVTDNNGCTATKLLTVGASNVVSIANTVTHTTCGGANGSVTLTCTGGGPEGVQNMSYAFDWSHLAGTANMQNLTFTAAGTYTVTVTSGSGCTASKAVTINSSTPVVITTTATQPTCGTRNGSIVLSVTGATSPTYDWAHISGAYNAANQYYLDAGTYTVTVTSSNGCTATKVVTLTQQGAITAINGTVTNNTAATAPYNGAISITVTGGISPFTYDWSHVAGTNNPQNATQIAGGNYTVTVTGGLGCTKTKSFTVINTNSPNPGNGGTTVLYTNGQDQVIEDGVSDTGEAILTEKARIFPNPATAIFNVDIPEKWGICTVRIYDSASRMIRQLEGAKLLEVDAGDLASGMYSVEIIPATFPDIPSVTLPVVIKRQ